MRKTETIRVPAWGGRDAGKVFQITEMPAMSAENWSWRLVLAVKGTTAEVPEEVAQLGMVGVATRALNSFLASDVDFAKIKPLLDEMFACVKRIRDPDNSPQLATDLVSDDDIEEVRTIAWCRAEVLRLHTNFSIVDYLLGLLAAMHRTKEGSPAT